MDQNEVDNQNDSSNESVKCTTCYRDITNESYVICSKCSNFTQCLECFCVGNETSTHMRTHPILIFDPSNKEIIRSGWTTTEEILLLHAVKICGIDNWQDIAEMVRTKNKVECEDHYYATYIERDTAPLPPNRKLPRLSPTPPPPYETRPRESYPSIGAEVHLKEHGKTERSTPAEYAGYMPQRNEFETEYKNEAEQFVADIKFNPKDETEESLRKKLRRLAAFNEVLQERHFRTSLIVDYGFLDNDECTLGARDEKEKEMENDILPLAQGIPKDILQDFIKALRDEQRIKTDYEKLTKWRNNGLVTRDEGEWFESYSKLKDDPNTSAEDIEEFNKKTQEMVESPTFRADIDMQLLSESEKEFCSAVGLPPQTYMRIKDILLREFVARGGLTKEEIGEIAPDCKDLMEEEFEFLNEVGAFN